MLLLPLNFNAKTYTPGTKDNVELTDINCVPYITFEILLAALDKLKVLYLIHMLLSSSLWGLRLYHRSYKLLYDIIEFLFYLLTFNPSTYYFS